MLPTWAEWSLLVGLHGSVPIGMANARGHFFVPRWVRDHERPLIARRACWPPPKGHKREEQIFGCDRELL